MQVPFPPSLITSKYVEEAKMAFRRMLASVPSPSSPPFLKSITALSSTPRLRFSSSHAEDDQTIPTIETILPFTSHKCDASSRSVETTPKELLTFSKDMALMRCMETAVETLCKAKLVGGYCHLYDGQEAVAVGMEGAVTKKDCIITAYRAPCIYLGRAGGPSWRSSRN